jgi:hypothetical protein
MTSHLKTLAVGMLGALVMILAYQLFLDHRRIQQVCANVATATQGKFVCW